MSKRATPRTDRHFSEKPFEQPDTVELMESLEREADELREALGDAQTTLRHCRLFISERKGYQSNEQKERIDITSSIDTSLRRITALRNTEPKES